MIPLDSRSDLDAGFTSLGATILYIRNPEELSPSLQRSAYVLEEFANIGMGQHFTNTCFN